MRNERHSPSGDAHLMDTAESWGAGRLRPLPCLTIAWHPDPARVGDVCPLEPPDDGVPESTRSLSRLAPVFMRASGEPSRPLADPRVSRRPILVTVESDGTVRLQRGDSPTAVSVDGEPLTGALRLPPERVERGVTILLAGVVLVVLHAVEPRLTRPGTDTFIGGSDAVARLRQEIERVAQQDFPVLVRGETGVGKDLVVRAIHRRCVRRDGPLVIAHVAEIPGPQAAAALFGQLGQDGLFQECRGGVLVLDRIGDAPPDLQLMLHQAIERRRVLRVGARRPEPVDVRVLATTDRDLRPAIAAEKFRRPLLDLLSGFELVVAPLRERREDIGPLLLAFLRDTLAAAGKEHRLGPAGLSHAPWLSASVVDSLVRYGWRGDVRQLQNVARQLAIAFQDDDVVPRARVDALVAEVPAGDAAPAAPAPPPRRPPSEIADEELLAALGRHHWRIAPTAAALGIARGSLYRVMDRSPLVRRAASVSEAELWRAFRDLDGDLAAMSERLQVSPQGLRLRLKQLRIV